jgi:uncharacterized repeat protein (TIGR03803 family)
VQGREAKRAVRKRRILPRKISLAFFANSRINGAVFPGSRPFLSLALLAAIATFCLFLTANVGAQSVDVRTATFLPYRSFALKDPKAVMIGDLNSDGRDDLVVATQTGIYQSAVYKLFVYLQTPDGFLSPAVEYPAGNSVSLAIADVNSDGRADLLCSTKKGFQVLYQNQSGTLAAPVEYISSWAGAEGGALLVGDFTDDGRPDVALIMSGPNVFPSMEIVQQTPAHDLVFATRYTAQGYSLIAGDFNSDGRTDIVTASYNQSFSVFRQLPSGGLAAPDIYTYPAGTSVISVAAGDVNGDGRDDVVVNQEASFPTIGVWLQTACGTLIDGPDYRAYQGATNLETGDFNGDGRADVVVLNGSWEGLSLYLQKSDGSFADREIYPSTYSQENREKYLATGDLNGDGQRDAVVLNQFGVFVFYHAPKNGERIANVASFDGLFASRTGATPLRELTADPNGNFYGATPDSGANGAGAIYRVTPDGLMTAVGQFGPSTGAHPVGSVVQGNDGNYYGTTTDNVGGAHNGTFFRLTPGGTVTTLYQFDGANGSQPLASLATGNDGNFYGTTSAGGASGYGVIFKVTPAGAYTVLHHFDGASGREPLARLKLGHDGLFYGTTRQGGASGAGTIFSVSPAGAFTLLASFDGANGAYPYSEVTETADGSFYGTASEGGDHGYGTIFKLQGTTSTAVYSFAPESGVYPEGGLALAGDGTSFYGTATQAGEGGYGTVFKFDTAGSFTVLSAFGFWNGAYPTSTPLLDNAGNLYGTTAEGGLFGDGSIYRIALNPPPPEKQTVPPANLSTRGFVGNGDTVLIGGYIIAGTAPKTVIMRALGPSLSDSGVAGAIADPTLALYDAQGNVIAENDNWREGPDAALIAATLPPKDKREAAIARQLPPGAYTGIVRGVGGTTGIGLVEIYDVEPQSDSKLLNLSTRVEVSSGARALIGGFIIPNGPPARIIVRAIGPSLWDLGFRGGYLSSPKIELRDAAGNLVASNTEWIHSPQKSAISATGLTPSHDDEPAIVVTVPPGSYTAVVQGNTSDTGTAVVEICALEH